MADERLKEAGFRGLLKGDSAEDIYRQLHPDIQRWLNSRTPESKEAILNNMKSMVPAERHGYGMSLVRP